MSFGEQIRQRADRLRRVPLESVLRLRGARPDCYDNKKWHTSRGVISVNGAKFFNWNCGSGGGGAIDLVMHLEGQCPFRQALDWLQRHFPDHLPLPEPGAARPALRLPPPDPAQLRRVQSYLVTRRAIAPVLVDALMRSGALYADARANAVFVLRAVANGGAAPAPVGAELRGTGPVRWCAMAPGSRKDKGFFSIPAAPAGAAAIENQRPIILCESAIDAISCFVLHPDHWCISTSGARPNPAWLPSLIAQNPERPFFCGFDADHTGDTMARAMTAFHYEVQRLRPPAHDWNTLLCSPH